MGNSSVTDHELVRRIRVNSLKIFFLHLRIIRKNFFFRDSRRQPPQYFFHRNAMSANTAPALLSASIVIRGWAAVVAILAISIFSIASIADFTMIVAHSVKPQRLAWASSRTNVPGLAE
jgi:hypothetical protein